MRRTPLKRTHPPDRSGEPGYRAWHSPLFGECAICAQPGRLVRHHVIAEQVVRREHGDPYDMRNSLELGAHCRCHSEHHAAARRLALEALPEDALCFAVDLLGEQRAAAYLQRLYR